MIVKTSDIISFLKRGKFNSVVLKSLYWKGKYFDPVIGRLLLFIGFTKNYFDFKEFALLFLPSAFKSERLRKKFSDFLNNEARMAFKDFIDKDGSINLYGTRFFPPQRNYYELAGLLLELIVFDQYKVKQYLRDGDIVIDAGANIGSFSVFASNIAKRVTVYSFEPVKSTFDILRRNTESYPNIHCYNLGLGNKEGTKEIFVYPGSTGGSTFKDSGMISARQNRVDELHKEYASIVTIDDFVEKNKIAKVDFIKIDTEGYELQILDGAKNTIEKFSPIISVSAYHHDYDKLEIPKLVNSINSRYKHDLFAGYEEDFIFYV